MFVIISKDGVMINADVNARNWLIMDGEGFIWNPSNHECECDKSCDVGE